MSSSRRSAPDAPNGAATSDGARPGFLERARYDLVESAKAHLRRAWKGIQVRPVTVRDALAEAEHVAVLIVQNEAIRFPFLLGYYRSIGVQHFLVIDNGSQDGLVDLLRDESDVSLWRADGQFRDARYGNDWVNYVLTRYCVGKWVLYVDADEFLVVAEPGATLEKICHRLETIGRRSLQAVMIDMYSDRPSMENFVARGQDPLEVCGLFDGEGYEARLDRLPNTRWIKGGVRGRMFFDEDRWAGPALNKTPLVRWRRGDAFLKSSHQLWPRPLNGSDSLPKAALLHFKFTVDAVRKTTDSDAASQHTSEYLAYSGLRDADFVSDATVRYTGPSDLVERGLIAPLG